MSAPVEQEIQIRDLTAGDLASVVRLDALYTGKRAQSYWQRRFADLLHGDDSVYRVGLGVAGSRGLLGYLMGEVRAFEFGSEPCGWIFAVGVDPKLTRTRVATALLDEATSRFKGRGVARVRTMVRRNDISVLSFFRSNGFTGGPFVQLERDLEEPT